MPLIQVQAVDFDGLMGIWEVSEAFDELSSSFSIDELKTIEAFHLHKKLEYLGSRVLINRMMYLLDIAQSKVLKDKFNKPYFESNHYKLSISHCYPMVVALIHPFRECGIDIERIDKKVLRVSHKFLNESEYTWAKANIEKNTFLWSAKETLYKVYGKKALSFKEKIGLDLENPLKLDKYSGHIKKPEGVKTYIVETLKFHDFIITFSLE